MDLCIEFDRQQLTFRTDLEPVRDFVARTFQHMLVPEVSVSAGELGFFSTGSGYSLRTISAIEFQKVSLTQLLPLVKDEVRLQFMRARPDLLWMHAGSVERNGKGLLLSGRSGQGKSTLTTHLCERQWRLLSDDVAPVRMHANRVLPFPQSPVRRLHPGRDVTAEELGMLPRETVELSSTSVCRGECEIAAVVFIEYASVSTPALVRLDQGAGAMELLRNATNFFDHRSEGVARAARLVRAVPMYRLTYASTVVATELLNGLW